jgi:hypothetical protein
MLIIVIMGYVYLILEVDKNGDEAHKIGVSKNSPDKRLKQLQTGNSNKLTLLKVYKSKNYIKVEAMLHGRYSNKQTLSRNEFFKLSNEEVIDFLTTCKKVDETINLLLRENHFFK